MRAAMSLVDQTIAINPGTDRVPSRPKVDTSWRRNRKTRQECAARQPGRAPQTFRVRVKISAKVMNCLIASGRLPANRTHDDFAVQRALQGFLHDECEKERKRGEAETKTL
jgi:hypothetical protein